MLPLVAAAALSAVLVVCVVLTRRAREEQAWRRAVRRGNWDLV